MNLYEARKAANGWVLMLER